MATLSDLLTIVRTDTLKDTGSTQRWSDAILTRMINQAIRASWPTVFVYVTDATTTTSQTAGIQTYTNREYSLPSGVPNYPNKCPVYKVECGPVGGSRISDALQFGDEWKVLATGLKRDPAWWVDFSRDKLILRDTPDYDTSGTYYYYLRIHYVRPVTELSGSTDVLEGPPALQQYIAEKCFELANRQRMTANIANPERFAGYGNLRKQSTELQDRIRIREGMRMSWPTRVV